MQRFMKTCLGMLLLALVFLLPASIFPPDVSAAPTTSLTIKKMAVDGATVLTQKTVTYQELMSGRLADGTTIPILGDGVTVYYGQGPVFADDPDPVVQATLRWNPQEDTNIQDKEYGAVKGTNVKDLCDLVGGMSDGETVRIKAADGFNKTFAYKNVYQYSVREGPMAVCWFKNGLYPDTGYADGMRLVWFADASVNPWGLHVFGNWDWHEAAEPAYWYYFDGKYPTTTGLSVQNVAEIVILSDDPVPTAEVPAAAFIADKTAGMAPLTVSFTDQSANAPTSWAWDFDNDGTVDSTLQNPSHTYTVPGSYTVKLSVSNAAGSDSETKAGYITVTVAADFPIQLIGSAAINLSKADMDAMLNLNNTYSSGGNIFAGVPLRQLLAKVDDADPASLNESLLGTYNIKFTGLEQNGADYLREVTAGNWGTVFTGGDVRTDDIFIATKVQIGGTGDFVDLPAVNPGSPAKNWRPAIVSGNNLSSNSYRVGGLYKIELTGITPVAPVAAFSAAPTSGTAPLTVNFTDASTGTTPLSWAWDFDNDGTVDSTVQNPSHTYTVPGSYTVKLSVSNAAGSDSETKAAYITVSAAPTMDVLYDGSVSLTSGGEFNQVAYNSGTAYTVSQTTPLGALQATGLAYDVSDKNYSSSGALLLDNLGPYPYVKGGSKWLAYVNDVYKDGFNNAPDALNLIQLADGDRVEYYYASGITDPTDLTAVKAAATAAVKTAADIAEPMDVLFQGTVHLAPGGTFNKIAYNSGTAYTVSQTTPLGALQATGLAYDVSDKNYSSSGALLLDNLGPYPYVKGGSKWLAYVNDVYKDGFNNAPDALNLLQLADGDRVEYYYASGITDPTDLTAVKAAATAAVKTAASTGAAPTDWTLQLTGAKSQSVNKAYFENGLACPHSGHQVFWTDDKGTPDDPSDDEVWGGVPLWSLVAMVDDDPDAGPLHYNFNDQLAAQNYNITVVSGDGWSTTLDSAAIARSDAYIVANTLNGQPLPLLTTSGKPCWPLQLKGASITGGQQVGNIVRIELAGLPEPSEGWTLQMLGQVGDTITQAEFEAGLACTGSHHLVSWTDTKGTADTSDDDVYSGVPLWVLLGAIDDIEMASHWTFSDTVAASTPYTVKITASDGYSRTFEGAATARNNDYIVANLMNGLPLTDNYPLRLVGDAVTKAGGGLSGAAVGQIARIDIPELQTPAPAPGSWNLKLKGRISDVLSQAEFEAGLACPRSGHLAQWTAANGDVWSGIPLWYLAGWVDDRQPHEFNTNLALSGYTVLVKAGDGYSKGFASSDVSWSNDYIIANKLNGQPLDDSWPLRLVGSALTRPDGSLSGSSVGGIAEIELTDFSAVVPVPQLRIVKYDADLTTIIDEKTVDHVWMERELDVIGDGSTIYRYEGLTLQPDNLWDPEETYPGGFKIANAIKGTRVRDLCELVGGMGGGTDIELIASDGYKTILPYSSIYPDPTVQARQGDAVLAWYADGKYVPAYGDGLRLFFTPEDHIYGQWDMHETLADNYWHFNYQNGVNYPSCAGLSTKNITTIKIYSVPATDWKLQLDGEAVDGMKYEVSKSYFETALGCTMGANHKATYTDGEGQVWAGMPLWLLVGYVDDSDQHSSDAFNAAKAQAGYRIVITASDGYAATIDSTNINRNSDYIVANTLDGVPLTEDSGNWPLKLVGPAVSKKVSVGQIARIDLLPALGPVAAFTSDIQTGTAPLTVAFTDQSTGTGPLSYAWDFDNDGTVDSTQANPTFTYVTAGTYSVKLTVTDANGSDDELKAGYITVNPAAAAPSAAFRASPTSGTAPLTVVFTDESTGTGPLSYAWDFDNDGTVDSTQANPTFTYVTAGTYSVKLTVTDANGSGEIVKDAFIRVAPGSADRIPPQWRAAQLTASDITETSLLLSWTPATDNIEITGYRVYVDGVLWDTVTGGTSNCRVDGLTAGTTYRFKVEAGDWAGNWTKNGPSARITTRDEQAPVWMDAQLLVQEKRTNFVLSWDAAVDNVQVTQYRVYCNGQLVAKTPGNRTTCTVSPGKLKRFYRPNRGGELIFTIQAGDKAGNWSSDGPSASSSDRNPK